MQEGLPKLGTNIVKIYADRIILKPQKRFKFSSKLSLGHDQGAKLSITEFLRFVFLSMVEV